MILTPGRTPVCWQELLGKAKSEAVAAKVAKANADFRELADRQKTLTPIQKWEQFSGSRPGIVPAGTKYSTRDIEVYENVVAIVRDGREHTQVQIGTLIHVGNTWKTIDLAVISGDGQPQVAAMGIFFQAAQAAPTAALPRSAPTRHRKRPSRRWKAWT